jgi:hypothetical protein
MVADAGKILDAAAANQHDRVFLKVMTNAWNISGYFRPM